MTYGGAFRHLLHRLSFIHPRISLRIIIFSTTSNSRNPETLCWLYTPSLGVMQQVLLMVQGLTVWIGTTLSVVTYRIKRMPSHFTPLILFFISRSLDAALSSTSTSIIAFPSSTPRISLRIHQMHYFHFVVHVASFCANSVSRCFIATLYIRFFNQYTGARGFRWPLH